MIGSKEVPTNLFDDAGLEVPRSNVYLNSDYDIRSQLRDGVHRIFGGSLVGYRIYYSGAGKEQTRCVDVLVSFKPSTEQLRDLAGVCGVRDDQKDRFVEAAYDGAWYPGAVGGHTGASVAVVKRNGKAKWFDGTPMENVECLGLIADHFERIAVEVRARAAARQAEAEVHRIAWKAKQARKRIEDMSKDYLVARK